jgi:hypothetical protein
MTVSESLGVGRAFSARRSSIGYHDPLVGT